MVRTKWLFLIGALQACGGDNGIADGGPDVTTTDSSKDSPGNDVTSTDGGACPSYTGNVEICKGAVTRCNTCGAGSINITSCESANFAAYCNWADSIFSAAAENAFGACATTCDGDAESACFNASLADASLTAAQQKMATDYCNRCGTSTGCLGAFAKQVNIVDYSDPLVTQVDTICTPDAGGPDSGACSKYLTCFGTVAQTALAGNPCADAASD